MSAASGLELLPGSPYPLGATLLPDGLVNFAIFSRHAETVDLCLFDPDQPAQPSHRVRFTRRTNEVWHAAIRGIAPGQRYAYRVNGRWDPDHGHWFNPDKLLHDPYARAFDGPSRWHKSMEATTPQGRASRRDSARHVSKCVLIDPAFDWEDDHAPRIPMEDSVLYELHVKGFTQLHPDLPPELRGTYAGLANEAVTSYLKDLGVTTLQLMPVHQHMDDGFLLHRKLVNYWGYNTVGFFAPEFRYAAKTDPNEQIREFKGMVKALHRAGLEVILDVVYNHTCEGSPAGPTTSLRGIDNRVYYLLDPKQPRHYYDYTGTGNTLNVAEPAGLQLVMDSLRYWVEEMHVDGFRFDLAVAVARERNGFFPDNAFFKAIRQDPVLSRVKLIAEPWDLGLDGYQVGGFPPPWCELNGRYRDTLRHFWKGDHGVSGHFAARITGSEDIYRPGGRGTGASVNLVTSHDGFTLADLVSYDHKHNEANGEENRDGDNHNLSWNHGVEGPTNSPAIAELRSRQRRNFLATLMLSLGPPFLLAGDERIRSQNGNNNAYCQDNELSWVSWETHPEVDEQVAYVRELLAFRRRHPVLRKRQFFSGKPIHGESYQDAHWFRPDGNPMMGVDWQADAPGAFAMTLHRDAADDGVEGAWCSEREHLLFLFNASPAPLDMVLPGPAHVSWRLAVDTRLHRIDIDQEDSPTLVGGTPTVVENRSLQIWTSADPLIDGPYRHADAPV